MNLNSKKKIVAFTHMLEPACMRLNKMQRSTQQTKQRKESREYCSKHVVENGKGIKRRIQYALCRNKIRKWLMSLLLPILSTF